MNIATNDLMSIDKCFFKIKNKENIDENLRKIEIILKRMFDMDFSVIIVNNTTNEFFGMSVYPDESTMDKLVENILSKKSSTDELVDLWHDNKTWYIEIDSILLYDMNLKANPSEMTAVLLHEIGHVVYSQSIPDKINRILRYSVMKLNFRLKALASNEKIRKLFNLSILEMCSTTSFSLISDRKKETIADSFVVKYGYGDQLNSFIQKLIASQGNSLVNKTEADQEKDVKAVVNWTINNIKELEFRKKDLKKALKVELLKTPSKVTKTIIQNIYSEFFGATTDRYRVLLSEQFTGESKDLYAELQAEAYLYEHVMRVLTEAKKGMFSSIGKVRKIQQSDIDILFVESERIDTNDDKIYLLDKLYDMMETINYSLELIDEGKSNRVQDSKATLLSKKEQLERIRSNIMNTKVLDKTYQLWVKSPRNFEG